MLAVGLSLRYASFVCEIKLMIPASQFFNSLLTYIYLHTIKFNLKCTVQWFQYIHRQPSITRSILGLYITLERNPEPIPVTSHFFPNFPSSRQPLIYFPSLQVCLFWTLHVNGIILCIMLCDCLLSFSRMSSRFIHVVACSSNSFFFIAKLYSTVWIYHIQFIHSSVDRHHDVFVKTE